MQRSKDIKSASGSHVGKLPGTAAGTLVVPEVEEGVVQTFFRISPELDIRIRHAAADLRCSKRELWIAAMEAYLSRITKAFEAQPDGLCRNCGNSVGAHREGTHLCPGQPWAEKAAS